jgi:hypothetical protein
MTAAFNGARTWGAFNGGWQIPTAPDVWSGNPAADGKLLGQTHYNLQCTNSISANGHGGDRAHVGFPSRFRSSTAIA